MKVKIQKIIMAVTLILIIAAWAMLLCTGSAQVEQPARAEPLTITTTPKSTVGTITVYDADGNVQYQYSGDFIHVDNSGWNGEDVEINVYIPYAADSCFDDEGRLKE